MVSAIRSAVSRWSSGFMAWLFRSKPLPQVAAPSFAQPAQTVLTPAPAADALRKRVVRQRCGAQFKRDVLDQLGHYFKYLSRMRKTDPEGYAFYSKMGAALERPFDISEGAILHTTQIEPYFLQAMPSFGAIMHAHPNKGEFVPVRFVYFTKYTKQPSKVQRTFPGSTFYTLTVYFDDTENKEIRAWGNGVSAQFHVAVSQTGEIRPLLQQITERQEIRHRKFSPLDASHSSVVAHYRWGVPGNIVDWARDNDVSPAQLMRNVFVLCVNRWCIHHTKSMVRIEARKGHTKAVISVDTLDIPDFFADRDASVKVNGKRAPIFHIVRPHKRNLANGKVVGVKAHFAGLRRFMWNGYHVAISVPGKDHVDPAAMNFGALDEDAAIRDGITDTVDMHRLADDFSARIDAGSMKGRAAISNAA